MKNRITSNNVTKLEPGQIFVFGSNTVGNHKKGAAKTAMKWGAIPGQGAGLQGLTYGIPTKPSNMRQVLSIDQIAVYVNTFIEFAILNPGLTFLVTEIGCGLSKYKPKDIAPLFQNAKEVTNIHLPSRFWHKIK